MDQGPSSEDLIREAKTWADPPSPVQAPQPAAEPRGPALEARYPSDRIAAGHRLPNGDRPPDPMAGMPAMGRSAGTGVRFGLFVALVGLGLAAFLTYRAVTGSEPVGIFTVTPGTCFMDPIGASIAEVEVVPCSESHDLEAFALVTLPFADGIAQPADDQLFGSAYDQCLPFFEPYTGEPYETSSWYLDAFVPDRRAWKSGDRGALCVLFLTDAGGSLVPSSQSARA